MVCDLLRFLADMVERRAEVVARLKALEEAAAPLVSFLQNPNAVQELRADKQYNLQMLNDRYQVRYFYFGIFLYSCETSLMWIFYQKEKILV